MGQVEEAKEADSVINGNNNDIGILLDEIVAIVLRISCSAHIEGAAVNPHYDRLLASSRLVSLPDVQIQAVLVRAIFNSRVTRCLDRGFPIVICLVNAVIRNNVHGCLPAQIPDGLLTYKRDALVGNNAVFLFADEDPVLALDS